MTNRPTPYQRMLNQAPTPTAQHGHPQNAGAPPYTQQARPAHMPVQNPHHIQRQAVPMHPPSSMESVRIAQPNAKKKMGLNKIKGAMAAGDEKSVKPMLMMVIAFLVFYVFIIGSKLVTDYKFGQKAYKAEHFTHAQGVASQISNEIDNTIIWINNGLSEGRNPSQSARLIAKSPGIQSALILSTTNEPIAGYPNSASRLAIIPTQDLESGAIKITSQTDKDGKTTPVIIKKTDDFIAIVALSENVLIKSAFNNEVRSILVAPPGEAIVGNPGILKLDASQLQTLSNNRTASVSSYRLNGRKHRLTNMPVPNSNMVLLEVQPAKATSGLKSNLAIFSILFLGTCALIWLLLNRLYDQLKETRAIQRETEISRQRYQAAVEGEMAGLWEFDLPNDSTYISASLATMLGLPDREHTMPVANFLGLFHLQERNRFLDFARRAHLQSEFEFDVRVAHLPIVLHCRGRHSNRAGRQFKRVIVGVANDITEQRGAQARLKSTEARLHNALSSMTDSFVVWDPNNRLVIWNVRFEDFFDVPAGTLAPMMNYIDVDFIAQQSIAEASIRNEGDPHYEIRLKDGRWIRYTETQTADGGRVSLGTDITEIRSREAELKENESTLQNTVNVLKQSQARIVELAERYEQEKIRAEGANQSKSDFLASMSHELRTPLNAINGFSDIMKKEMFGPLGDPRYKEYISDILFSGQHLLALINDILDMSKIEAGKMTLNSEVMFMHDMIEQVVRIIRGRAEEAQLDLDIKTHKVREIEADPRAVKQILLNLITNAIKFTPEGGTVGVEVIEKKTGLIIKVTDTGIGISPENIQRLAKPFEQVEEKGANQQEGTGLGLALSKSLVELHGGNFKIESEVGAGTTIIFSLPNTPVSKPQQPVKQETKISEEISRVADDMALVIEDAEKFGGNEASPYPYVPPIVEVLSPAPIQQEPAQQQELIQVQSAPQQTGRPAA